MATPLTRLGRLFSSDVIQFSLRSRSRSGLFLLTLLAPGFATAVKSVKIGVALTLADSFVPSNLQRATLLDPTNAEIHSRLGNMLFYSLTEPNEALGVQHFRRATELNPYRARYWAGLAIACRLRGDRPGAGEAFGRAVKSSPMTPRYRWLAANYDLWAGRPDEAKGQLRRLLEMVQVARAEEADEFSHYSQPTFRLALSAFKEPRLVFEEVLPSGRGAALKLDYVYYLAVNGQAGPAYRLWGQVVADVLPFPFALARPYVDYLLNSGRFQEGAGVWKDLERLGAVAKPAPGDQDNLVFNGSFEAPPLNSGLDWRHADLSYPPISFSDPQAYQGHRCLRVDFNARMNDGYKPVYEYVPVIPDRMYVLTGYTRSRNITSDSGPRLRVLDPAHPNQLDTATEPTLGTTGWHPVSLTFRAPAETNLVQVSVWRQRSVTFPPEVTGTFWVDAVSLKAAPPAPEKTG